MQKFDIVVYGASSFVGQIICRYLAEYSQQHEAVNWAMAGRSREKLEALRQSLPSHAQQIPVLVAEANDEAAIKKMCASTKVILSTVGPYALYGETLLKTCVSLGVDYCDLTGEPQWIASMLRRYESVAKITGARIVHCCGFDSVPSDLGVYQLQQHAINSTGAPCQAVKMRVLKMQGAASGGTVASMLNMVREATTDSHTRKVMLDPYSLCPTQHSFSAKQFEQRLAKYDHDLAGWTAPFIMAAINTRIVHRSNALLNNQYSTHFTYEEAMLTGKNLLGGGLAMGVSTGIAGFVGLSALPPSRWLLEKFVLPKPGEGPSLEAQNKGHYCLRFIGKTQQGEFIQSQVNGDKDPGYGSTAQIIGQAAICLANNQVLENCAGGFWTPASAFGEHLIKRLNQHAGVTFDCPLD